MATLHQRRTHPEPVEGCFACKIGTIGYDGRNISRTTVDYEPMKATVLSPDGEAKTIRTGKVRSEVTEHRDGRQDVTLKPPTMRYKLTSLKEE